jgi:hypothetical protein
LWRIAPLVYAVTTVHGCAANDQATLFEGCVASTLVAGDPDKGTFVDCEVRNRAWVISAPGDVSAEALVKTGLPREVALMVAARHDSNGRWCISEASDLGSSNSATAGNPRYTLECVSSAVRMRTPTASYGRVFRIQLGPVQSGTRELTQFSQIRD